jgi:tellurite resistance protein TerC
MYFLIANLMDKFIYLKEGLSVVLVWVGAKMIISHAGPKIPTSLSLLVIITVMSVAIGLSLRKKEGSDA